MGLFTNNRPQDSRLGGGWLPIVGLLVLLSFGCAGPPEVDDRTLNDATAEAFWATCRPIEVDGFEWIRCGSVLLHVMPEREFLKPDTIAALQDGISAEKASVENRAVRTVYRYRPDPKDERFVWAMELKDEPGMIGLCAPGGKVDDCPSILPIVLQDPARAELAGLTVPPQVPGRSAFPEGTPNPFGSEVGDQERFWRSCEVLESGERRVRTKCGTMMFTFFPVSSHSALHSSWRSRTSGEELPAPMNAISLFGHEASRSFLQVEGEGESEIGEITQTYHWVDDGFDCRQLGDLREIGTSWFQAGIRTMPGVVPPESGPPQQFRPEMLPEKFVVLNVGNGKIWADGNEAASLENGFVPADEKKGGETGLVIEELLSAVAAMEVTATVLIVDRGVPYRTVTHVIYTGSRVVKGGWVFAFPSRSRPARLLCTSSKERVRCVPRANGPVEVNLMDVTIRTPLAPPMSVMGQCGLGERDVVTAIRNLEGVRGCYLAELDRNPSASGSAVGTVDRRFLLEETNGLSEDMKWCLRRHVVVRKPSPVEKCTTRFRIEFSPVGPTVTIDGASIDVDTGRVLRAR